MIFQVVFQLRDYPTSCRRSSNTCKKRQSHCFGEMASREVPNQRLEKDLRPVRIALWSRPLSLGVRRKRRRGRRVAFMSTTGWLIPNGRRSWHGLRRQKKNSLEATPTHSKLCGPMLMMLRFAELSAVWNVDGKTWQLASTGPVRNTPMAPAAGRKLEQQIWGRVLNLDIQRKR